MTALAHRVEGEDGRAEGLVTVAAPEFLLSSILAPAVPTLRTLHPGLALDLRSDFDTVDLIRGEADIAVRFARPASEAVVARRVGSVAVALFCSQDYVTRLGMPADGRFDGHDLLLLEGAIGRMPAMGWMLSQMEGANIAMRANEVGPLVAAVKAGAGIACLPAIAFRGDESVVVVPPGVVGRCDLYLATHRDLRTRARVRSAFDFVARLLGQHSASLSGADIGHAPVATVAARSAKVPT